MIIEKIELIPASKYLFVKVTTDSGIEGIGEMGAWGYLDACAGALEKLKDYLIGKDPHQIEHHWNYMYRSMYFRGSVILSAISAIDIALWDILGKSLGVPVYQLLGGKTRNKVRTYAPVFESDPEKMAQGCLALKAQGFTAARLMICGTMRTNQMTREEDIFNVKIADYVNRVRVCREAVGDDFDLCLEVHRSMTPAQAVAFARGVEPYRPLFLEDPIAPDSLESMVDVSRRISIPVATGERAVSLQEMESICQQKAANFVRPDVCVVGGISAAKKIAAIAEANYIQIAPHNPLGPVSTAACLQLDACIPNFLIQEFPSYYHAGAEDGMTKTPLKVEEGYIYIPDAPGIGIELVDDITEKYPPAQRSLSVMNAFDGSVHDR
ncbi:D-galactonate dehydratase [Vibrio aerogenes CECT 7868]|uniref:D-galactonate dehydratase n=1 Tax=Vibrio aerogenes CECT 7868 TaxID=1216006 RepID=A0A1M5XCR3_9VIBR|nr:mandelate racemase/muconate lactonizing enzyme family protein [Vibrio aerogenes]SHH97647.1 D-galactonate dehydratase [Vibrio aerogenes CECT 7868]